MLSTAKSLTDEPKSIIPDRKKDRDKTPSASLNSGTDINCELFVEGNEKVTLAGNGSSYILPFKPRYSSSLSLTSSSNTLNGEDPVLFITILLLPASPVAPSS